MLVAEEAVEIRRLRRPGFDGTETRACTRDLRSCVDRESVSVSGGAIARIRQNLSARDFARFNALESGKR
jgi:hypothetical protein